LTEGEDLGEVFKITCKVPTLAGFFTLLYPHFILWSTKLLGGHGRTVTELALPDLCAKDGSHSLFLFRQDTNPDDPDYSLHRHIRKKYYGICRDAKFCVSTAHKKII
jgi:hypothetical protein